MTTSLDLLTRANEYRDALPVRIRQYLNARGITDDVIALHRLGWNGSRITIPIAGQDGSLACFKLAKDPDDHSQAPKMLTSRGARVELFGWERVLAKPTRIVFCEGEFDRLVLEGRGIAAVTSTGGAGSLRPEWAPDFAAIPEVYLCFDRDDAGRIGMQRVGQFIPHAKIIELPEEVGLGGDVTDFFVRLGRGRGDFLRLMDSAVPVPVVPASLPVATAPRWKRPFNHLDRRVAAAKAAVPITDVITRYVALRPSGANLRGLCPLHDDHNPSLMVDSTTDTFRCYGCGRHGDVLTFLMAIEGSPFLAALSRLEEIAAHHHGSLAA